MDIEEGDLLLCEFYFSDAKGSKHRGVLVFKTIFLLMILLVFPSVVRFRVCMMMSF